MKALAAACLTVLSLQAQPVPHRFTLPNGLRVVHLEDHDRPLVRVLLHLDLEPADTPAGHPGLPQLAVRMFDRSDAGSLKPDEFQRLLEASGIQWSRSLDPGGLSWRLLARSRDQDRALGLLADRLLRTILDPQILEDQRLACWHEEESRQASPRAFLLDALIPGSLPRPTVAGLGSVNFEDLVAFRNRVVRPDRAVLVLHGDLGLEQAKRLVLLNLGSWTSPRPSTVPEAPPTAGKPAPPASPAALLRVPSEGLGLQLQAVAVRPVELGTETAALLSLLVAGDPALAPVQVLAQDHALTATLLAGPGVPGPGAWRLLHDRLESLRQRGFTQVDLDHGRAAWSARRLLDHLHPDAQVDAALDEALGRGVSAERIQGTSLDALNAGLRLWLDPANLHSGAIGDAESLKALPNP